MSERLKRRVTRSMGSTPRIRSTRLSVYYKDCRSVGNQFMLIRPCLRRYPDDGLTPGSLFMQTADVRSFKSG